MRLFLIFLSIIIFVIVYTGTKLLLTINISKQLIANTQLFKNESKDYTKTLLVIGDSTAVGVGAKSSEESLPGLVAKKINATYVENYAVSGSEVKDLPLQIEKLKLEHYDMILVQIGANDIVARHNAGEVSQDLEAILLSLTNKTDKLVFLTAGNVGGAPAIPFFMRSYYTRLTLSYHTQFELLAKKTNSTYVNLYESPASDPFVKDSEHYFAKDSFHPSSLGYAYWFKKVEKVI